MEKVTNDRSANKNVLLQVRMTREERNAVRVQAMFKGMTISEYIRSLLRETKNVAEV